MSKCGITHHTGCECHEAERNAEIARLRSEIEREFQESGRLMRELECMKKDRDQWESNCIGRAREHEKHLDDMARLRSELQKGNAEYEKLLQERDKLQADLKASVEDISRLLSDEQKTYDELEQARKDNRALEGRINGLQLALEQAREELSQVNHWRLKMEHAAQDANKLRDRARAWAKRWKRSAKRWQGKALGACDSTIELLRCRSALERALEAINKIRSPLPDQIYGVCGVLRIALNGSDTKPSHVTEHATQRLCNSDRKEGGT